jgi:hypothetical protein
MGVPSSAEGRIALAELGAVRRYAYWSDRRVQSIASDNNIRLNPRWRLAVRSPAAAPVPQIEISESQRSAQRHEVAEKIENAIGRVAVEDFVTPPPASFAKGLGEVTFAAYTRWSAEAKETRAVILHARHVSSTGVRVELCLFGSIENCAGYLAASTANAPMWSSSSTWAIEDFIGNRGTEAAPIYDDEESIAVEILRVLNNEGMTAKHVFKRIASAEWFAEIYHDVELDKDRWRALKVGVDVPEPVDRIVVGAPIWIRSMSN